jgi:glycosyltransferase involved in cell wall biosynthesis
VAESTPGTIDALVVASWFPSYEDAGAGRFVADQVEALAATGVVRPAVVSFDPARLSGGAASRERQARVVLGAATSAVAVAQSLFVMPAWGVDDALPVGRLTIPEGLTRTAGTAHGAIHRSRLLSALADRVGAAPGTPVAGPGSLAAGPGSLAAGVVHAHTAYPDGAAAVDLAERLGWPLFVTEHASFVPRLIAAPVLRDQYARVLERAERLFAVSQMLADELVSAFPEHGAKITVLPNTVPVDLFRPVGLDARRPEELLFVGYRKAHKGIENLLRAFAIAYTSRPSLSLRLVGRTPDEDEERGWHAMAAALGVGDAVTFDEAHDREGVVAAMARASLFVHPSPRETFGVVAVEALASGMPVVATDSGGVTEILGPEPDRLGALVPVDDPDALATAILRTLDRRASFDPAELREAVERRFGSSFVAERIILAYREAIARSVDGGRRLDITSVVRSRPHPTPRLVVVALDRESAARRLGPLPERIRADLTVVTAVEPSDRDLPQVGTLVETAVETTWRVVPAPVSSRPRRGLAGRLARLAADPVGTLRRRLGRDAGSDRSLAPATETLRRLIAEIGPVELLAVDGHDHLAVDPLVRSGVASRNAGGLRRLADERG